MKKPHSQVWQVVLSFYKLLNLKDQFSAYKCRRVASLSFLIAGTFAGPLDRFQDNRRVEGLYAGCLLKDIGKIGIPDEILHKPGRLTTHELEIFRGYPKLGFEAIERLPLPWPEVHNIVRYSKEKYDGSGFPFGLARDDIPLEAQVVAAADFYESLTLPQPSRLGFQPEQALELLKEGSGSSFNPLIVDAFSSVFDKVVASTGEESVPEFMFGSE
jgi:HD-GYP domain-containing protein (c-di-GMP phosphodiesterase class II)